MEYVRAAVGRNGQRFEYELLFDGNVDRSAPQMIGLIDVVALVAAPSESIATSATSQGETTGLAPSLQAARTELAPTVQGSTLAANAGRSETGTRRRPTS